MISPKRRILGLSAAIALLVTGCSGASTSTSDLPARGQGALTASGIDRANVRCNSHQVWNKDLMRDVKAGVAEIVSELDAMEVPLQDEQRKQLRKRLRSVVMWRQIRTLLLAGHFNNLGVVPLRGVKTADGKPVVLFRSGFTPRPGEPGSCFESLVKVAGVRHVANLYAGPMATTDLEKGEKTAIQQAGGSYFLARDAAEGQAEWREHLREGEHDEAAKKAVASIINNHLLRPGGKAPSGNLHVHCGGGMHRTGMVVGVIDRCVNGTDKETLEADYKRHVGWRSDANPGGFEKDNLAFILGFDCGLIRK